MFHDCIVDGPSCLIDRQILVTMACYYQPVSLLDLFWDNIASTCNEYGFVKHLNAKSFNGLMNIEVDRKVCRLKSL